MIDGKIKRKQDITEVNFTVNKSLSKDEVRILLKTLKDCFGIGAVTISHAELIVANVIQKAYGDSTTTYNMVDDVVDYHIKSMKDDSSYSGRYLTPFKTKTKNIDFRRKWSINEN